MDIYISVLESVKAPSSRQALLSEIVEKIKDGTYKNQVEAIRDEKSSKVQGELKLELPAFKPCLLHEDNTKKLSVKAVPTGLVQLELDVKDDLEADVSDIRAKLLQIPELIYCFSSPRKGLKFAIKTDFVKPEEDDLANLKNGFNQAYKLVEAYVLGKVNFVPDKNLQRISQSCFVSFDEDAYLNLDCEIFCVSEQIKASLKQVFNATRIDVPEGQVAELLDYIPADYSYDQRLPINFSVFSSMGSDGIQLLLNHWSTTNRKKLEKDLNQQCEKMQFGSIGALVNQAKKYGYKQPNGKQRSKLKAERIDYQFEPFFSVETAEQKLKSIIGNFFEKKETTFVNISAGAGKTTTAIQILSQIPWYKYILYLVPTHALAEQIVATFEAARNELIKSGGADLDQLIESGDPDAELLKQLKQLMIGMENSQITHLKGQAQEGMCGEPEVLKEYSDANLSIPVTYCMHHCMKYQTQGCNYIEQFDSMGPQGVSNIRVMTHAELILEQSRWFHGNAGSDGSPPRWFRGNAGNDGSLPSDVQRKPDYIVVDEDWIKTDECVATLETEFPSLRGVILDMLVGISIEESLSKYGEEILVEYDVASTQKMPVYEEQYQYISDIKRWNMQRKDFDILEAFNHYIDTGDDMELKRMKLIGKRLYYFRMKAIQKRNINIPTLFLDATANEAVVRRMVDVTNFHSIRVKPKNDIEVYQAENFNVTMTWLEKDGSLDKLIKFLRRITSKYESVGIITYKNIKKQRDFDVWLANKAGVDVYAHFGDLRGKNKFEDVDCLIVIGRYLLPQSAMQSNAQAIFGEEVAEDGGNFISPNQVFVDVPVRMKDGSAMAIKNMIFEDSRLEAVRKHFCEAETIQAVGRARLIWGKAKHVYLLSKEVLTDIEVTKFITEDEVFPNDEYDAVIDRLKVVGFCRNTPKELENLGVTKSHAKNKREEIALAFKDKGVVLKSISYIDKQRKYVKHDYFVYSVDKLEKHIQSKEGRSFKICANTA